MKITKFVHSCLLIETDDRVGVIDPGQFSWESGLFSVDSLTRLDDIIITHEHFDHFHLPFVQALMQKFPEVRIFTNPTVAEKLRVEGITNVSTESAEGVELLVTPHEALAPLGEAPDHTGVHYLGRLTHPGDSHHFSETKEILALPVTAPWGSMMAAASLALQLKPKYIVPIHDWHWNEAARKNAYNTLETFFAQHGITFAKSQDGVAFEL